MAYTDIADTKEAVRLKGQSNNDMHRSRRSAVLTLSFNAARRPGDVGRYAAQSQPQACRIRELRLGLSNGWSSRPQTGNRPQSNG
jgi:hypothetical protein